MAAYATRTLADILDGLEVDADRMRANLEQLGGMVYSEALLLAMVAKGADRQAAYRLVQGAAKRAWTGEASFREALRADPAVGEWLVRRRDRRAPWTSTITSPASRSPTARSASTRPD